VSNCDPRHYIRQPDERLDHLEDSPEKALMRALLVQVIDSLLEQKRDAPEWQDDYRWLFEDQDACVTFEDVCQHLSYSSDSVRDGVLRLMQDGKRINRMQIREVPRGPDLPDDCVTPNNGDGHDWRGHQHITHCGKDDLRYCALCGARSYWVRHQEEPQIIYHALRQDPYLIRPPEERVPTCPYQGTDGIAPIDPARFRAARLERKLSVRGMAQNLKVGMTAIQNWERGSSPVPHWAWLALEPEEVEP